MIDERHEELAALYALDLLEGDELARFESALARDAALQTLARELRAASSSLALVAPTLSPPADLRERVLASVADDRVAAAPDNVLRPPLALFRTLLPWAAAACVALVAVWLGQLYLTTRSENALLRGEQALADLALRSTRQQAEAERILSRRQLDDLGQQLAGTSRDLTAARSQLADREQQVATLTRRVDALAGASAELGRQFGAAKQRVAELTLELLNQAELANSKITALASLLDNSPQALAVALWDPAKQQGVLQVEKLPALAANQDYQLWVVDPQYPNPVDGGVFTVDARTGTARFNFKAKQPVKAVAAFAVTLERKGGVPKAEGPFVLLGK